MSYILENEFLKITSHNHGAELHSIKGKKEGIEFLWDGNPEFWKYHAPLLFPIVGKVKENTYKIDGEIFTLPQHGLGRLSDFILLEENHNSISFKLDYSEESLKVYPFKFSLIVKYTLVDSTIEISYTVKNLDNKKIYFSIGAHPAYMCPIGNTESLNDYYFEFNDKESTSIMLLNKSNGLFTRNKKSLLENESKINLCKELFENDALVFESSKLNSNKISLKSKNHKKFIEFNFTNFPYLGLWAPATGAPFVCIEPWFGHADFEDFNGEFKDKTGIIPLDLNNEFNCHYSLTIHQ